MSVRQWNDGDYMIDVHARHIDLTGYNLLSYKLRAPGKEDDKTWGRSLTKNLERFPGIKIARLNVESGLIHSNQPITNTETIRIRTTLNYDVFTDLDFLHKLQNCTSPTNAKKVALKINSKIAHGGVASLPDVLGKALIKS